MRVERTVRDRRQRRRPALLDGSTDPTPSWATDHLSGYVSDVDCPTQSVHRRGGPYIDSSTNPAGGASAWNASLVDVLDCYPCLSETLTAVDDQGAHTLDTAPPGAGTHVADLAFTGNTVTWTHDGVARSAVQR